MKYLFEDNIDKFPYRLLTNEFRSIVSGSNGNKNLKKLCRTDYSQDTYVLIDVSADNPCTISYYNTLAKEAADRKNQFIIPIPSVEYYFIRAFIGYLNQDFSTALSFGDFKLFTKKNYENFLKDLINTHRDCYGSRKFEEMPCLCDKAEKDCIPVTLQIKSKKFELSLPLLLSKDYTEDTVRNIIESQKALYYKQAESFCNLGIIKTILKLKY